MSDLDKIALAKAIDYMARKAGVTQAMVTEDPRRASNLAAIRIPLREVPKLTAAMKQLQNLDTWGI